MTRRLLTLTMADAVTVERSANPRCPECHGAGVVPAEWTDGKDDVMCSCVDPRVWRRLEQPRTSRSD